MGRVPLIVLFSALLTVTARGADTDPYAGITIQKLRNGMTVVLAPSPYARTIEMELRVLSGWSAEDPDTPGIAHLVEHAVFRDERLAADDSYLQLIKEKAGGNANGVTSWNSTSFTASLPSLKGIWALNEFSRMLMNRKFTDTQIEKCRREVLLEVGEPDNLLQQFLAQFHRLLPARPDFFETEFGIRGKTMAEDQVRRRTLTLGAADAQEFYRRHYVPNNMVLFYAGPFRVKETLDFVKSTFEVFPEQESFEASPDPDPKPRNRPYYRSRVATRDAWISYGAKFWNIEPEDEMALRLYFEFVSHRLMKKLRNEAAQTYTADVDLYVDEKRYGYAAVSFETPRDRYQESLRFLDELVREETQARALKNADIVKARELLASDTELIEKDSESMIRLAERLWQFRRAYGREDTPWQVFQKLDEDSIRERLKALLRPQHRYLSTIEPPLLFRGEWLGLVAFLLTLAVWLGRKLLLRPFEHTSVRYVRKIKYRPIFVLGYACFVVLILAGYCRVVGLADRALLHWPLFQSTYLLSEYVEGAIFLVGAVAAVLAFLALLPRKIIVTDKDLVLKSFTYFSRRFRLTSVRRVVVCRWHHIFTRGIWRTRLRWLHWSPLRKGIVLELDRRRAYYLGFSNADEVFEELQEILHAPSPAAASAVPPAAPAAPTAATAATAATGK